MQKLNLWDRVSRVFFWLTIPIFLPAMPIQLAVGMLMEEIWKRVDKRPGCVWAIALLALVAIAASLLFDVEFEMEIDVAKRFVAILRRETGFGANELS